MYDDDEPYDESEGFEPDDYEPDENEPEDYDEPRFRPALFALVWEHASDCWLLERTDSTTTYTEGSPYESVALAAGDLWRDGHARALILTLHADPTQLAAALDVSRRIRANLSRFQHWPEIAAEHVSRLLPPPTVPPTYLPRHAVWTVGVDLCHRALHITHQAGADTNPGDRHRLLAGLDHHVTMTRYGGFICHHKHRNARALPARLARIDHRYPPG